MDHQTKDHYSKNLITVSGWESPAQALMIMKNHKLRHLPVVSEESEEIVGLVSDRDLLAALQDENVFIKDIMAKNLISHEITTPLKIIVDELLRKKVSSSLVRKNGVVCGIITTEDLLYLLSELLTTEEEDGNFISLEPFLIRDRSPFYNFNIVV